MSLNKAYEAFKRNPELETEFLKELLQYVTATVARCAHDKSTFSNIEDAISEAAFDVWSALGKYDKTKGAFKTWVTQIVLNRVRKALRSYKRDRGHFVHVELNADMPNAATTPSQSNKLILKEFLESLSPTNRSIVQMDLDGLTNLEIAEALELSLDTVKGRLRRIYR